MHRRILYGLTYLAATLSMAHHIDHVIRHNAVGWPMTGEVNPFTMSLIIYPIIITGLLLYRAGRVGPGFWALVSGGGATPPAMQPSGNAATEVEAASVVLGGAPLLVAARIGLWAGLQLVVAGLMIANGAVPAGQALNAAAGWWIAYAGLSTLAPLV
jgi:hypothetical protein